MNTEPPSIEETLEALERENRMLRDEIARMDQLINTPKTDDFYEAVTLEAAHQIERWGTQHDAGKGPADWFWLIGYLAGKAMHFPNKRQHHIISSAAALLNWWRQELNITNAMRPGIAPPESENA